VQAELQSATAHLRAGEKSKAVSILLDACRDYEGLQRSEDHGELRRQLVDVLSQFVRSDKTTLNEPTLLTIVDATEQQAAKINDGNQDVLRTLTDDQPREFKLRFMQHVLSTRQRIRPDDQQAIDEISASIARL
jgi:hypothetical protein